MGPGASLFWLGTSELSRTIWAPWNRLMGLFSGVRFSALALFRNFQPSLLRQLRQPLLGTPGAEQRDALRSEPLLGDRHELLERFIAGIPK